MAMRSAGGVGDVAFVPEGDVLQGGQGVGADRAGESADALGLLRVALVRHGGGAGLTLGEGFADFADFGALEVANLGREALQRGGDHGEGGEEVGVAVALDDLGGDGFDAESEFAADALLDVGRDGGVGADGAGDLADGDGFDGVGESAAVAAGFVDPTGQFEAEGGRLAVDPVRASDAEGVLVFDGALGDGGFEPFEVVFDDASGVADLEGGGGVPDVGGGESVVDPARLGPERVGDGAEEGERVVVDFGLVAVDVGDVVAGVGGDEFGVLAGDDALVGPGVDDGDLDIEPAPPLGVIGPERGHLRPLVAGDH